MNQYRLSLPEQILILHLDERSGRIGGSYTPTLIAAATIAELALQGHIRVTEKRNFLANHAATDNTEENALLNNLANARNGLSLLEAAPSALRQRLQETAIQNLVARGIWATDEEHFLFIHRKIYAAIDPKIAEQVKHDLQNTLESHQPVGDSQAVLLGLLKAARKLDLVLERQERRFFEGRIATLIADLPVADALCHQIEAIIANDEATAVTTAVIIASS